MCRMVGTFFHTSMVALSSPARYRDVVAAIMADQAGADQCSEARKQLIRRFAAAAVLAEQIEARLANGEEISVERHAVLSSISFIDTVLHDP